MLPVQSPRNDFFSSRMHGAAGSTHARATGMRSKFERFVHTLRGASGSVKRQMPVDAPEQTEQTEQRDVLPSGRPENICQSRVLEQPPEDSPPSASHEAEVYWNKAGAAYLKVEGGDVKLRQDAVHQNLYFYKSHGRRHQFCLRNNRFFPEPVAQHLPKALADGLSAGKSGERENRHPVNIVCRVMNADEQAVRRWLTQFQFDKDGPHSEMQFALYLEKHGKRPAWAEGLRHGLLQRTEGTSSAGILPRPKVQQDDFDDVLSLGSFIGGGMHGILYRDRENSAYVIKRMKWRATASNSELAAFPRFAGETDFIPVSRRLHDARKEAALFCRYYGADAAEVKVDKHDVFIRMLRVPGVPIQAVLKFPEDAIQRYTDMLGHLQAAGIMHGDLHRGNILYDAVGQRFYPVDLSDMQISYFRARQDRKQQFNLLGDYLWNTVTEDIKGKMPGSSR